MRRLAAAGLLLAACGGGDGAFGDDEVLGCHVAHRASVEAAMAEEREVLLEAGEEEVVAAGPLTWRATHSVDEGEGRALVVRVEEAGRPVTSDLYQVEEGLRNQFRGGHGFTGLRYAYASDGAEVQWWCVRQE